MLSPRHLIAILVAGAALGGCATPPENPAARVAEELPPLPPLAFEPCVAEAIAFDATAWREYQRDLRELIATDDPDREALATIGMKYRSALIDREERRRMWLLEQDPQRFVVDDGVEGFRAEIWTDEDQAALEAAGRGTTELDGEIDSLFQQYNADPGLRLFSEYFQTRLRHTPRYERIAADLRDAELELERMLERCSPYGDDGAAGDDAAAADADTDTEE